MRGGHIPAFCNVPTTACRGQSAKLAYERSLMSRRLDTDWLRDSVWEPLVMTPGLHSRCNWAFAVRLAQGVSEPKPSMRNLDVGLNLSSESQFRHASFVMFVCLGMATPGRLANAEHLRWKCGRRLTGLERRNSSLERDGP